MLDIFVGDFIVYPIIDFAVLHVPLYLVKSRAAVQLKFLITVYLAIKKINLS